MRQRPRQTNCLALTALVPGHWGANGVVRVSRRGMTQERSAFTLLEVILALAIMAGAVAILGELTRTGLINSQRARELTRGELVCESVMTQIATGALSASSTSDVAFDDDPRWLYSIDVQSASQPGLIAVTVTAVRDAPPEQQPVKFQLVRWMIDPGIEQAAESSASATSSATQ